MEEEELNIAVMSSDINNSPNSVFEKNEIQGKILEVTNEFEIINETDSVINSARDNKVDNPDVPVNQGDKMSVVVIDIESDEDSPTIDHLNKDDLPENSNEAQNSSIYKLEDEEKERENNEKFRQQEMTTTTTSEEERIEKFKSLRRFADNERIFPDVRPSNFHTIAFNLATDYKPGDGLPPHPLNFVSKWEPKYVPMPCCDANYRIIKVKNPNYNFNQSSLNGENGQSKEREFIEKEILMWDRITKGLQIPMLCSEDILNVMKYCKSIPITGNIQALQYTIEKLMNEEERTKFFEKVLPNIVKLCLELKNAVTCPLPLLTRFMNYSISLSQKQIATLLANAFFSTFPGPIEDYNSFPIINFNELFQSTDGRCSGRTIVKAQKIRCILHYFERITDEVPKGIVTFTRKSMRNSKAPEWKNSTKKLTQIIPLYNGNIETDGDRLLKVDFANKFVGGGVLSSGCVQEEILFIIYPELLVSMLFTQKLTSCEALIITGCERFSNYIGYAGNFKYDGDFYDCTPWDSKGRKISQIVAIDALYISKPNTQFHPHQMQRELNKAYVGFSTPTACSIGVATGKWGCGAFNGDPILKSILQLLSASEAGRDLAFFTFNDSPLQWNIEGILSSIKDMTVGEVWKHLCRYYSLYCTDPKIKPTSSLVDYFKEIQECCEEFLFDEDFSMDDFPPSPPNENSTNLKEEEEGNKAGGISTNNFYSKPQQTDGEGTSTDWIKNCQSFSSNFTKKKEGNNLVPEKVKFNPLKTDEIEKMLEDESETLEDNPFAKTFANIDVKSDNSMARKGVKNSFNSSSTSPEVPKQKRQLTLKDFYKDSNVK